MLALSDQLALVWRCCMFWGGLSCGLLVYSLSTALFKMRRLASGLPL
jgi:hypothetical protein